MRKNCLQPGLLLEQKPLTNQEATVLAELSIKKLNIAQIFGSLTQNPSMSPDAGSTSEWRRGKNYKRNQKRKQRKRLWKELEGLNLTNPGDNLQTACNSASTKRSMESSKHSIENVRAASEGAEKLENPEQGLKATTALWRSS